MSFEHNQLKTERENHANYKQEEKANTDLKVYKVWFKGIECFEEVYANDIGSAILIALNIVSEYEQVYDIHDIKKVELIV